MTIAVLLTTYNRKEITLACLRSLKNQQLPDNVFLDYYLTDDGSDGTKEAVEKEFKDINIYEGNGNLFWAGGMRNSWTHALTSNPDYYFLINDDTILKENAIESLLKCNLNTNNNNAKAVIAVGSTNDVENGQVSYG